MWIYGPNRKEKFETLPSFARYPARFPSFKIAGPTLYFHMAKKKLFQSVPCGYSKLVSQVA